MDTRIFKTQLTCLNNPNRNPTTKLTPTQKLYIHLGYYDPALGRFINADGHASTGQGVLGGNMFAYCGNNPVNRVDPSGQLWFLIVLVVVVIVAPATLTSCSPSPKPTLAPPTYTNLDGPINDIPYVPKPLTPEQENAKLAIAQTIYGEERGVTSTKYSDWQDGQWAIATTIYNTAISWGTSPENVCYPSKFNGVVPGKEHYESGTVYQGANAVAWDSAMVYAEQLVRGEFTPHPLLVDPRYQYNYANDGTAAAGRASAHPSAVIIGGNIFYNRWFWND